MRLIITANRVTPGVYSRCYTVLVLLLCAASARAQTVTLTGAVRDRAAREAIPGAALHILGTSRGALTNVDGNYRLALDRGTHYTIRVTAIGYRPDTLRVTLFGDSTETIALVPAPLIGKPIIISANSSREEARRIMHKVIDSKDAWQSQIKDYSFHVYSRGDVRLGSDTSNNILAILESVANGYWKRGQGYAERITARHETADIPAELNRVALFDVENFYNDRIDVQDYNVVSPVAHDAFTRYDYDLLGEGTLNGVDIWKIEVDPLNSIFPAFSGTLWIDKTDYTIVYLDLSPNDAIQLGPIKDVHLEQTFSFVDNKFWMPSDLNFTLDVKLELPIVPVIHFSQTATLQNYAINTGLPDSLFLRGKHTVSPSADSVDSLHWVAMRTIPLARSEDTAYRVWDSVTRRVDSLLSHPQPPSFDPLSLALDFISTDLYQYNRVEGSDFHLEHDWKLTELHPLILNLMAAYGIGDARWKYSAGFTQALTMRPASAVTVSIPLGGDFHFTSIKAPPEVSSSIGGRIYDEYIRLGTAYDPIVNTLTALFLHSDYPNYYRAKGFEIDYDLNPKSIFSAQLHFKNEVESSVPNVTDFSLLDKRDTFRTNPAINDGRLHEMGGWLTVTPDLGNWDGSVSVNINYSAPGIGSQFNYATGQLDLSLEGKMGGWGKGWFEAKYSDLLSGALPAQSLFIFEARDAVIAPRGVFRTMSPFEFQGDRAWSLQYEQNFYDLPTRLVGIKMPIDLHWLGFANIAGASLSDKTNAFQPAPTATLGSTPFAEAGFGIGNILNILRFDATWRLTHRLAHNFFVTGTMAFSF
ncbi:MAG TPA: DUF5686 family protein [Candidatus Kapabacteria bacterium]|nr:DUF5686 family protein [Candidatus Kapabacteria bacterium]